MAGPKTFQEIFGASVGVEINEEKQCNIHKFISQFSPWIIFLALSVLPLSGCSTSSFSLPGFTFWDKNQGMQGPEPLIEPESFEEIDLALILDPTTHSANSDDKKNPRKRLEKAFKAFDDKMDLKKSKNKRALYRNRIQDRIIAASNQRCGAYKQFIKKFDSESNLFLGAITTAAAGAGAIFTPASTVRALSGIAAIVSGIRAEVNESYFQSRTVQVLTKGFETKRASIHMEILENREKDESATKYTVRRAIGDAIRYHDHCSIVAGLEEVADAIERVDDPGLTRMAGFFEKFGKVKRKQEEALTKPVGPKITAPDDLTVPTKDSTEISKDDDRIKKFLAKATAEDQLGGDLSKDITNNAPEKFKIGKTKKVDFFVKDSAGKSATAQASVTVEPDTTAPKLKTATVTGTSLVLTYEEKSELDADSEPDKGDFVIGSPPGQSVTAADIVGKDVTLTLNPGVAEGDTVKVSYTPGAKPIRDKAFDHKDESNNAATFANQLVKNTTVPVLATATVTRTTLVMTYTKAKALDLASQPAKGDFEIANSGAPQTVNAVAIAGKAVTLTLTPGVAEGDTVKVSYTPGAKPIQGTAGNDAAKLVNQAVTNKTDTTAPVLKTATVTGTSLVMNYTEANGLDLNSKPVPGDFVIEKAGTPQTVNTVAIASKAVTLTLASAVAIGDTVKVSYTAGTNPIRDTEGNNAAKLVKHPVNVVGP